MSAPNAITAPSPTPLVLNEQQAQYRASGEQAKMAKQYLDRHDAQQYLEQVLSQHKAVFEALKYR